MTSWSFCFLQELIKTSDKHHSPGNVLEIKERRKGEPLFSNVSRGNRYGIKVKGQFTYPDAGSRDMTLGTKLTEMELQWDGRAERGEGCCFISIVSFKFCFSPPSPHPQALHPVRSSPTPNKTSKVRFVNFQSQWVFFVLKQCEQW